MKKLLITCGILLSLGLLGFLGSKYFGSDLANLYNFLKNKQELHISLPGKLFGPSGNQTQVLKTEKIIYWTNQYRLENNLKALSMNLLLTQAAQKKVDDMFENQYFDHVSPSGTTPSDLVISVGYNYKYTGENLALGNFPDEKQLVDAWMASPGHRANILNQNYTEIGVAVGTGPFEDRENTLISVQEFGSPAPNCTLPDKNLSNQISSERNQAAKLKTDIDTKIKQEQTLVNQANDLTRKGNDIYAQTGDAAQAQKYWKEADTIKAQVSQIDLEVKNKQAELQSLERSINQSIETYNSEVNKYNRCIL